MNEIDEELKQLHESDLALDGRIRRLEAAVLPSPGQPDALHERVKLIEADLAVARADAQRWKQAHGDVEQRLSEALMRRQSMDRFWEKLTDSLADSTSQLAARFGNDNTWDELIAMAVERLDELDTRCD